MKERSKVTFEPAALSVEDAAKYCGIGVQAMWKEVCAGKVDARKDGRRTVIMVASLKRRLEALPKR